MMKTLSAATVVAVGLLSSGSAFAQVVKDGTFEQFLANGTTPWSTGGNATVELGANGNIFDFGQITQTLTDAVVGQVYNLTVSLGKTNLTSLYGTNNFLSVFYGGSNLGNYVASTLPTTLSTSFTAIAGGSLRFVGDSGNEFVSFTVDDVKITAIPGPIAGAGLPVIAGMIAYGFYRRRQQIAA
ncbi:hypothetical protein [Chthonobacter albigriseus]|uniref:hypothetical protein n=1 Tax=Chthonobacter albigriseus TaxID=1683161 RepID=UPI0015EF3784|nr:hypothetical protein [Chthonobacter albigriseus]